MTRPLTCADRLPKQGDIIVRGHEPTTLALSDTWWYISEAGTNPARQPNWTMQRITNRGEKSANVYHNAAWIIEQYRYVERADGGTVTWPIDAGAFV